MALHADPAVAAPFVQSFELLRPILQQPCESAVSAALHCAVLESAAHERAVARGLLYGMLTQPRAASSLFRHMCCLRDIGVVLSELVELVLWRYAKLAQSAKQQLLWALSQLVTARACGVPRLALALLRQIGSGDSSAANRWLADNMLSLLTHHFAWVRDEPSLAAPVLLTFLRLAAEHDDESLRAQQQRELKLCAKLWACRQRECLRLGRELWRVLQPLRSTPPAAAFWLQLQDMQTRADAAGEPGPLGVVASPAHLAVRVNPEAERCVRFMLGELRAGDEARHLRWFAERHLQGRSSGAVQDLVRWLCVAVHPTNAQLSSALLPRWKLVSWLLRQQVPPPAPLHREGAGSVREAADAAASISHALVLDFLGFGVGENIMHVEPAALLLFNWRGDGSPPGPGGRSFGSGSGSGDCDSGGHARDAVVKPLESQQQRWRQLAVNVLRALLDATSELMPSCADGMRRAVCRAFASCVRAGVLPSLDFLPLLDAHLGAPRLGRELPGLQTDTLAGTRAVESKSMPAKRSNM